MNIIKKVFGFFLTLSLAGGAMAATVGSWTEVSQTEGTFSINYKDTTTELTATPYEGLDGLVWYYDANLKQSPEYIENVVVQRYELGIDTLELAVACNAGDQNCIGADLGNDNGTYTFSAEEGFHYLAVHLGGAELLFHWADAITNFTLSGLPGGSLSNYRAFVDLTITPEVFVLANPLPGAALLFASAFGLGRIGRRKKAKA